MKAVPTGGGMGVSFLILTLELASWPAVAGCEIRPATSEADGGRDEIAEVCD